MGLDSPQKSLVDFLAGTLDSRVTIGERILDISISSLAQKSKVNFFINLWKCQIFVIFDP
jgi:hypothetical protein